MDDNHAGQMAALKMCIDRQLPVSLFEKEARRGNNAVTINITGIDVPKMIDVVEQDPEDES